MKPAPNTLLGKAAVSNLLVHGHGLGNSETHKQAQLQEDVGLQCG